MTDNYQTKKLQVLRDRENDLVRLLAAGPTQDSKKIMKAAELVKKAKIRCLAGRLEFIEVQIRPTDSFLQISNRMGKKEIANFNRETHNLKRKLDMWEDMPLAEIIDKYKRRTDA